MAGDLPPLVKKTESGRNYGIDLLRILAMLYVVILHCLGKGGVLDAAAKGSSQYMTGWFLEAWAYGAVNIFAIISGYVGYSDKEKKIKYTSYLLMWLQVVFYGLLVSLVFKLIHADYVTKNDFLDMLLPVSNGLYWYFTAYTGLFFLIPLLNAAVRGSSEKQLKIMLVTILIVYVLFDNTVRNFGMSAGYSLLWLVLLYLIGAVMKRLCIGENIKPWKAFIGIGILIIMSWLWRIFDLSFSVSGVTVNNKWLISYTSPTILGAAMLHVIAFSKIKLPKVTEKVIGVLAKGAFAVYILNNQRFIWKYVMNKNFMHLAETPALLMAGRILLFSVAFVIMALLIDQVRMFLFRLCRINYLAEKLSGVLEKLTDRIK